MRKRIKKYLTLIFVITAILSTLSSKAQNALISGKIIDAETKLPIEGVTIKVQGTNTVTQSDENGAFLIKAKIGQTLSVTHIGYLHQQIKLTENSIVISLKSIATQLDEVVVTGTSEGTTKRQLGSYVATVKADQLANSTSGNVLAALQGKTAGAQITQNSGDPAGGISVRLRGISTISGSSEPLYIIDGVIVDNSTNRVTNTDPSYAGQNFVGTIGTNRLADINPDDIDHIEVLNGAAATAVYGSRANAGVIQIFTKRGSIGTPIVNFSTNAGINQLRKQIPVNNAPVKFGGDPMLQTQTILTPSITNTTAVQRYNYQDYIFQTGLRNENNISVSGGKDKTKYYASAGYLYNEGIIRNTNFNRYSFRLNLEQTMTKWMSFNLTTNYIYDFGNEKPDGNTFFSPTNAVTIIGNYYDIKKRDALGNIQAVGERGRVNPVSVIEDFKQKQTVSRIISGIGLKINPLKNLSFDYHMGIDNYSQNGITYLPPYAYNVSTAFYGGGPILDPTLNGYASTATNNYFQINHDANLTYRFNINKNLSSVTQLGFSQQYFKNNYTLLQGRGLPPSVQSVGGASTLLPGADQRSEVSISGEFIQQNFKYRNQFFITGAIRVDGSSVFATSQRNQVYTKLSGSYVISGTDFWGKLRVSHWWNLFKIRSAYGESGNLTGIPAYGRFNTLFASPFLGRASFQTGSAYTNPNIKPERQSEIEIGTDMAFFNNRLNLTFNYYNKNVNDLIINRLIAPTNGYSSLWDNIGSLKNQGYELVLNFIPIQKKNFTWEATIIYNHNKNEATNIGQQLILYNTNGGAPVAIIAGQPIGVFYGTFFARNNNGNLIKNTSGIPLTEAGVQNTVLTYTPGRNQSGLPSGSVLQKVIGNPNPRYTGTITNDFSYKKLLLHIQIDAVQGVDVFNADFRTRQGVDNGTVAQQEDLGQLSRGYIAGVYPIQEWRIDNGSFVKLREISIGYRLGNIKYFKDLTINLSGRNLISWDNYKGYDPEVNAGGQSTILRGIDFGTVPIPKTFSLGISTKF